MLFICENLHYLQIYTTNVFLFIIEWASETGRCVTKASVKICLRENLEAVSLEQKPQSSRQLWILFGMLSPGPLCFTMAFHSICVTWPSVMPWHGFSFKYYTEKSRFFFSSATIHGEYLIWLSQSPGEAKVAVTGQFFTDHF